jgi:serine/threonine-protein kinase
MSHGPSPGQRVGPYELRAELGEGAMGVVFLAERDDGVAVALKVLRRVLGSDAVYTRRFAHEARAAQEVVHRHLVPVLDAGEADGYRYLAVAYVEGQTLEARLAADGRLAVTEAVKLAAEIGGALDALHTGGLVHRDVKPSNVMIDLGGSASLTDFGLAKGPAYTVLTRPGQVMGTLDYLAPELLAGGEALPASDLYALGCMVFECLAGAAPFADRTVFEIGLAHLSEEPPDPCAARTDCPPDLTWAVRQALAKDPADRPPSGTAYANMLAVASRPRPG